MNKFSEKIHNCIAKCTSAKMPFILYRIGNSLKFYSSETANYTDVFTARHHSITIQPWDSTSSPIRFGTLLDEDETLVFFKNNNVRQSVADDEQNTVCDKSTCQEEYIASVNTLIDKLKIHNGKVVISRTTCGNAENVDWTSVAEKYFDTLKDTFGFFYYTPQTGFWLGASPELLLEHKAGSKSCRTMALAGTRKYCETSKWDDKNIEEHNFVVRYIHDRMSENGLDVVVETTRSRKFGDIEHLCTPIQASASDESSVRYESLLKALHPTPALCGYPTEFAKSEIKNTEKHQRGCYGGYIRISDEEGDRAFVNLRCVNFNARNWCVFSGGGIIADSTASEEWNESERKAEKLVQIIRQCTKL